VPLLLENSESAQKLADAYDELDESMVNEMQMDYDERLLE